MIKKLILAVIFIIILVNSIGCSNSSEMISTNGKSDGNSLYFSYDQFRKLVEESKALKIDGFNYVDTTPGYTVVDKEATFNKRTFMTVDNTENDKTTQIRLSFADNNFNNIILINYL